MENEQIKEMSEVIASIICEIYRPDCDEYEPHDCGKCFANSTPIGAFAEDLYNAGYRKQSEPISCGHEKGGEWISVDERLPERPGAYLVFTCDRRISMCHFIDHYCDGNMQFDDYRVTHWMPLPEPPKMKGGE